MLNEFVTASKEVVANFSVSSREVMTLDYRVIGPTVCVKRQEKN